MRSEHKMSADEIDAFTGWRKVLFWRPGQRKAVKARSHRRDRRTWKQAEHEDGSGW